MTGNVCKSCAIKQDVSCFPITGRKVLADGSPVQYRSSICQRCKVAYNKKRRHERGQPGSLKARLLRKVNKQRAVDYLGGRCVDCQHGYHLSAYDFHHLDPIKKDINPSSLMNRPWDVIKKEIDKCVLLCSNCHRRRHWIEEENQDG